MVQPAGNGKPGSVKSGPGGRRINITVDAAPLVRSMTAHQEGGSAGNPDEEHSSRPCDAHAKACGI